LPSITVILYVTDTARIRYRHEIAVLDAGRRSGLVQRVRLIQPDLDAGTKAASELTNTSVAPAVANAVVAACGARITTCH
jgi:hypothetical protein